MSNIMKTLIKKYPIISRLSLTIILFGCALVASGFINNLIIQDYFPYTSVILLILVTLILLKIDNLSTQYIGLNITPRNISFLFIGIGIGAIAFLLVKLCRGLVTGETLEFTTVDINYKAMLYGLYLLLPSVAVEEFLFRGYAFKKTIELTNVTIANIIFAILFMLIHVLDREVLKSTGMIIFFLVTIPIGHLLFSTALLKSKTIFFPIGIHLGNNWATQHLISNVNNGNSFLFIPESYTFETWTPFILVIIIWNLFYLGVILLIWKWDQLSKYIFALKQRIF